MRGGTNRLLNFPVTGLTRRIASKFRAAKSMEITIGCLTLLHENFAHVACHFRSRGQNLKNLTRQSVRS